MEDITLPHWQRNFRLFLGGQFLSGITSMIVQYSLIWYLTNETSSATVLSFAMILGMLPMVFLSPLVGPIIDRGNKKKILIITDVIVAFFAVLLSLTGGLTDEFPLWLIFVSLFIRAVAQTFQMPTIQSVMPTLVPEAALTKANGQLGMVQSANMIIAPALGAFLFGFMPLKFLVLLDVLGAILGVGMLLQVKIPQIASLGEKIHLLADTKFGFKKLYENTGLFKITLIGSLFTILFMPAASLYPLMTTSYFKGSIGQAGLIEVVYSVGMLFGGGVIGLFGKWTNRMVPILAAYFVLGVTILWSGLLPENATGFFWFVVLNTFAGIATPFFNTLLMAMIQQSYAVEELGRVLGVLNSLMSLAGPLGLIFAGPLADFLGVEKIFVIAGVGTLFCGFLTWVIKDTRNYDQKLQRQLQKIKDEDQ